MYRGVKEGERAPRSVSVAVEDLVAGYDSEVVLRGVSFALREGQVYGLVGPNGAGKSTLLRCLAGIHVPFRGRVSVGGVDLAERDAMSRARVVLMPDTPPIFDKLTVREHLRIAADLCRLIEGRDQRITDWISRVGLSGYDDHLAKNLSLGQRQRMSVARVMLAAPDLALLDEPANGMDPDARVMLAEVVREAAREGATVLLSSHVLSELDTVCDEFVMLQHGSVRGVGTAQELAGDSRDDAVVLVTFYEAVADGQARLEQALSALPEVQVERCEHDRARLRMPDGLELRGRALAALVGAGLPVVDFARERTQITEVYSQQMSDRSKR